MRGAIWGGGGVRGPGALASPLLRLHNKAATLSSASCAVVFLQNRGCAERTPCGAHLAHCAMLYLTRKLVRRALYQEITHETYSKTRANSSRVYMEEFSVSHVDST